MLLNLFPTMKIKDYQDRYYKRNNQLSPHKQKTISIIADLIIWFYKIPHEAIIWKDISSKKILSSWQRNRKIWAASATGVNMWIIWYGLYDWYSKELLELFALSTTIHRTAYWLSLINKTSISQTIKKYTIWTSIVLTTTLWTLSSTDPIQFNRRQKQDQYIQRKYLTHNTNETL